MEKTSNHEWATTFIITVNTVSQARDLGLLYLFTYCTTDVCIVMAIRAFQNIRILDSI